MHPQKAIKIRRLGRNRIGITSKHGQFHKSKRFDKNSRSIRSPSDDSSVYIEDY